ncbi:MAG: hypothetical protein ACE5H3_05785 [Planctomycetota bacterium]
MPLRIPFLILAASFGFLFWASPGPNPPLVQENPVPAGVSLAWKARLKAAAGDPGPLLVRARTLAERLRTGTSEDAWAGVNRELNIAAATLARLPRARALPWRDWILENRHRYPELSLALLKQASGILGREDLMALALELDQRITPRPLRLEALSLLWTLDPMTGRNRTSRLFREDARANDTLRAEVVGRILRPRRGPLVDEVLLQDVVQQNSMEDRARRLAIEALSEHGMTEASADLEVIFRSDARSLILRTTALMAVLNLDPARGRLLLDLQPNPADQPVLFGFLQRLRKEYGLSPFPSGGS